MPSKLTVAIPLFKGVRWIPNIIDNIAKIPDDARIILSDQNESDDAVKILSQVFKNDPRVLIRVRRGKNGWREHCNALINENDSEMFSLLPQDDSISTSY